MDYLRSDALLMEILKEKKSITGFLDAVFGFLKRNTDFYHIKTNTTEEIGFPKGIKERILFTMMQRFDPEYGTNQLTTEDDDSYVPPAIEEVEVACDMNKQEEQSACLPAEQKATNCKKKPNELPNQPTFSHTDYINGACFETYCWSQTLKDVEVHVLLPEHLRAAKTLSVDIEAGRISVRSKKTGAAVVEGTLSNRCKHNNVVWTIAEDKLLLNLEKIKEMWWEKLFISEPAIDVQKINCERYIDELPEASQLAIEKLRVDQIRQDKGIGTDNSSICEDENLKKLRQAWNLEGSPFRGHPFDPAMVQFN